MAVAQGADRPRAARAKDFRTEFDPGDLRSHEPDPGDPLWQESFCIVWHDPVTRSGGNHHFSLWRNTGVADVWSWVVVEGVEVGREQEHELPIPDEDVSDTTVGGMRVVSHGDFRNYTLEHTLDGCTVVVRFSAYVDPVELDYARGGASLGTRHFETLGAVEVDVQLGDRLLALTGVAFQDHSWGHRELERNPAGQWMFAVFDRNLMASVYLRQTVTGPDQDGWVFHDGRLQRARTASVLATIANDGLYPRSSVFDVWTDEGGYRFSAQLQAGAVEGGIGLFAGDGLMTFECGGRLGGGLVELKPLRFALPEHRAVLRLPE